jgi:hypothetical protein
VSPFEPRQRHPVGVGGSLGEIVGAGEDDAHAERELLQILAGELIRLVDQQNRRQRS